MVSELLSEDDLALVVGIEIHVKDIHVVIAMVIDNDAA